MIVTISYCNIHDACIICIILPASSNRPPALAWNKQVERHAHARRHTYRCIRENVYAWNEYECTDLLCQYVDIQLYLHSYVYVCLPICIGK